MHFGKGKGCVADILGAAKASATHSFVSGKFHKKSQHQFYMEGQSCLAIPEEDGVTVWCAAQGTEMVQKAVSRCTGLPQANVGVKFKRVGGGFGGKLALPSQIAAVASQLALKTRHAVRLVLPRDVDMQLCGGRQEIDSTWEAAIGEDGVIKALKYDIWMAHGQAENTQKINAHIIAAAIDEVYRIPDISVDIHLVKQHVVDRTAVRAPGHFEVGNLYFARRAGACLAGGCRG
jgi:xanthine dehydrogenase large subunit